MAENIQSDLSEVYKILKNLEENKSSPSCNHVWLEVPEEWGYIHSDFPKGVIPVAYTCLSCKKRKLEIEADIFCITVFSELDLEHLVPKDASVTKIFVTKE